jgi:hypothetical protein
MKTAIVCLFIICAAACGDNSLEPVDAAPDASAADAAQPIDAATIRPDSSITLACTLQELQPIFTCVQTGCATDLTLACIATKCGLLVLTLSPSCRQCVITGLTSGNIGTTTAACVSGLPNGGM